MAWFLNLFMVGRGSPIDGEGNPAPSFTTLSCNGTPGVYRTFAAKSAAGTSRGFLFYLRHYGGIG